MRIKKGDKVIIIKGKDRGKTGKILKVTPANSRITIEGLNLIKKTVRPKKQGEKGQIIEVPGAIRSENIQLVCPSCGKPTRLGYKQEEASKKRYCKKCKATV